MDDFYYTEEAIKERIKLFGEIAKLKRTIDEVSVTAMRDGWYDPGSCESGDHIPSMFTSEKMAGGIQVPAVWMHILVDMVYNKVVSMDQVRTAFKNGEELSQIMHSSEKQFVAKLMEFILSKEKKTAETS